MAQLVVEGHANWAEADAAKPGAVESLPAGGDIGGRGDYCGKGVGEGLYAFKR